MVRVNPRLSRVLFAAMLAGTLAAPAFSASVDYYLKIPDIDGESETKGDKHRQEIDVLSWSWGETRAAGYELGKVQVKSWATSGAGAAQAEAANDRLRNAGPKNGTAESGGGHEVEFEVVAGQSAAPPPGEAEITLKGAAKRRPSGDVTLKRGSAAAEASGVRVAVGDVTGDGSDTATPMATLAQPMATGSLTAVVPAGTCRAGARYPWVEFGSRERRYTLKNAVVAACAPAAAAGDSAPMETLSLNYEEVK